MSNVEIGAFLNIVPRLVRRGYELVIRGRRVPHVIV